ncbi:MAG: outer membrane beta-barrel protein [Chitinophagaceae bacterium]
MKKFLLIACTFCIAQTSQAQFWKKKSKDSTTTIKKEVVSKPETKDLPKKVVDPKKMANRVADHFMIQYGAENWANRPDSVRLGGGFSRHFNFYLMTDKPFKTNPKFSVGYGIGIGSSNMFFDKTYVNIKATTNRLPFTNVANTNHFEKFKVTTIYLEVPVEVRYTLNPEEPASSWRFALGAKVGTILKTYSKGKNLVTANGASVFGPSYIQKESNNRFFTSQRLSVTSRISYGIFGVHGSFDITPVLKDGLGAPMNRYSIGVVLSGL